MAFFILIQNSKGEGEMLPPVILEHVINFNEEKVMPGIFLDIIWNAKIGEK